MLDGAKSFAGNAGNMAGNAGRFLVSEAGGGLIGAGTQAYHEAPAMQRVLDAPGATDIDKGTQFSEAAARTLGTGAGAGAGLTIGTAAGTLAAPFTGPLAPVMPFVGGAVGTAVGGLFGNKATDSAIHAGRTLAGTDTASPADRLPTEPAAPTRIPFDQLPQASYSNEGNNYRGANPALREQYAGQKAMDADLRNPMSNASLQKINPGGQVMKEGNTYSGGNVSGLVSLTDGNGKALSGQPRGGMISGSGDGSFRFASPDEMARYKAEKDGLRNGGNTFQDAVNARLRGMGVNSERDLSTRTLSALYGAVQTQLGDKQAAATNLTQQENNRQMSLDRQLQATSAERVKKLEIENQNAIRARIGTYMNAGGKKGGEQDIGAARAAALRSGDTSALELIDKYIKDSQDHAKGKTDIVKSQDDELKRRIAPRAFDKDGLPTDKIDEAGQAAIINQARAQYPGLDQMGSKEKDAILSRMGAEHSLLQKLNAAKTGQANLSWHGFTPTYNGNVPTTQTAPDLRGGQIEQAGWLNGVGRSSGDISITGLRGGSGEFNLGQLSAEEMSALKRWTNMKQATAKE